MSHRQRFSLCSPMEASRKSTVRRKTANDLNNLSPNMQFLMRRVSTSYIIPATLDEFPDKLHEMSDILTKWERILHKYLPRAREFIPNSEIKEHCEIIGEIFDRLGEKKSTLLSLQLGSSPYEDKPNDYRDILGPLSEVSSLWKTVNVRVQEWQQILQSHFLNNGETNRTLDYVEKELAFITTSVDHEEPFPYDKQDIKEKKADQLNNIRYSMIPLDTKLNEIIACVVHLKKEFVTPKRKENMQKIEDRARALMKKMGFEKSRINNYIDITEGKEKKSESIVSIRSSQHRETVISNLAIELQGDFRPSIQSLGSQIYWDDSEVDEEEEKNQDKKPAVDPKYGEFWEQLMKWKHLFDRNEDRPDYVARFQGPRASINIYHSTSSYLQKMLLLVSHTFPVDLFFLLLLAMILFFISPGCNIGPNCRTIDRRKYLLSKSWLDQPPI